MNKAFSVILLISIYHISCAQDIQSPIVADLFYPGDSANLKTMLKKFYDRVPAQKDYREVYALISPHAGYIYSGQVAAFGYQCLKNKNYDCIIIIGPSHRFGQGSVVVDQRDGHKTPFGLLHYDKKLAQQLLKQKNIFSFHPAAFSQEHSIEVQLPFLQTMFDPDKLKILEIVMVNQEWGTVQTLARTIIDLTKGMKVLVVASSDFSHYHPYQKAIILDEKAISFIKKIDAQGLYQALVLNQCEACGGGPVMVALLVAKKLGADACNILCYANSGDVTGDSARVVGYLAAVLYKSEAGIDLGLEENDKKFLHTIARRAVVEATKNRNITSAEVLKGFKNIPEKIKGLYGVFVTIKSHDMLRGCIGRMQSDRPLYQTTAEMAIAAATEDPRFRPITKDELKSIHLEISVLTPLRKVKNLADIEVGRDGLLIKKGIFSGVLLPQVAVENRWDKITFLEETCHKAGLYKNAWKDKDTEIYAFSAQVF